MSRSGRLFGEEIGKSLKNGIKEADRIAKEIGGHIPERVADDGLLTLSEQKNIKYITISLDQYEDIIRDAGYYQGRSDMLEEIMEKLLTDSNNI